MSIFTQSTTAELAQKGEDSQNLQHQKAIVELLQTFNPGVQNSFFTGGVQGLKDCCTAEGYAKMEVKYKTWREKQIRELNLVSCEFLSFTLVPPESEKDELSALAYTFEKWVFVYENGEQKPTRGSVDRYVLIYEGEHWKVDSVMTYAGEG